MIRHRSKSRPLALLRLFALAVLATAAVGSWPAAAAAQAFPNRPVRIVVPQPPGTASDTVARILADQLAKYWHQNVVIETKPGAGGTIAADHATQMRCLFVNSRAPIDRRLLRSSLRLRP